MRLAKSWLRDYRRAVEDVSALYGAVILEAARRPALAEALGRRLTALAEPGAPARPAPDDTAPLGGKTLFHLNRLEKTLRHRDQSDPRVVDATH